VNTVYTVAFSDNMFLMVLNPKRNGWEMPGGKIEKNENAIDAAKREYLEESGYAIDVISMREMNNCYVCVAYLREKVSNGELPSELFAELPDNLAFERSEYDGVLEWAWSVMKIV
jgi:8-oxo-dGTP diphosphatase